MSIGPRVHRRTDSCCLPQTIFDAFNHGSLHWAFALCFFICLVISGIANLTEIAGRPPTWGPVGPELQELESSLCKDCTCKYLGTGMPV